MEVQNNKISFEFNSKKALEAVLYALSLRPSLNFYNLLKVIYEADKTHLNEYGRPITGDIYKAMPKGTVPSNIYDMLKVARSGLSNEVDVVEHICSKKREPNLDVLSESDLESIKNGVEKYGHLSFQEVYTTNHKEKAWINSQQNAEIPFESMIEDEEVLKDLINARECGLKLVI